MGRQTQTRERLVRTAAELFWRQGYAQTGVSAIMKRAQATSGSFYHFFPTKDDLLLAVLDAVHQMVEEEILDAAEAAADSPEARVAKVAESYRDRVVSGGVGFGIPVGTLVTELGPGLEAALQRTDEIYQRLADRIAGWLPDRPSVPEADQPAVAGFIVGALEGAALLARAGGSAAPMDACARQLAHLVGGLEQDGVPNVRGLAVTAGDDLTAGDWKAW